MTWNTLSDDSKVLDHYRFLSGITSEQAWIACSWINSMLAHGYTPSDIKLVIDTYPTAARTYALSPERFAFTRSSRYYNMAQPIILSIGTLVGAIGAYCVAKPAAVTAAVGGATAITAATGASALLVGPTVAIGATILITGLISYPDKLTNMREKKFIANSDHEINCMKIFLDAILANIIVPSSVEGKSNYIILSGFFNPIIPLSKLASGKGIYKQAVMDDGSAIMFTVPMAETPWTKVLERPWASDKTKP